MSCRSDVREIILGQVVALYVRSDAVDAANLHVDQLKMDAVGRLGGHSYTRTRDQFEHRTPTPSEWFASDGQRAAS